MYKIGNVVFDVKNVINKRLLIGLESFRTNLKNPEIIYEIIYVDDFEIDTTYPCIFHNKNLNVQKTHQGLRWNYLYENTIYAVMEETKGEYFVYLHKDVLTMDLHQYFLPSLFCLERVLVDKDAFILHSSYISLADQAILFTAPSGGGKSTQADLWMKYMGAEILNGDRNIVGKENLQWYVYGTPFSGSSKYCINRTTPLRAIVILEKGVSNILTRVDAKGFRNVFSQTTINSWDQNLCVKIMDLVMQICEDIPIYLYSCTKEKDAVDGLYNVLVKDGILRGISE